MPPDDVSRASAAEAIRALYPFAPYVVVLSALGAAIAGADSQAWLPLLVAGAALIKPAS